MDRYAIYTYQLTEKSRRNDTLPMDTTSPFERMTSKEKFEFLFPKTTGAKLQIQKFKKHGTADKYPCLVLRNDADIVLLRLINDKDVNIWEEQETTNPIPKIEKTKRKSKPYCYIIVDNRPGVQLIAIQSNSAAWRNTNDVKELLQESLNWLLDVKDLGLEVTILSKMMPSKFWDYVDRKRKKDNVYIKSMTFSFTNHMRRPDIDIRQALSSEWKHFDSFIGWIDKLGGDKGELKITPPKDDALMKRKLADIKHMVEICMNANYALSVTFSDDITYKCNQELRAELPLKEDSYREEFEAGMHDIFYPYKLEVWLDDVIEKTKEYDDVEEIRPKPVRKAR